MPLETQSSDQDSIPWIASLDSTLAMLGVMTLLILASAVALSNGVDRAKAAEDKAQLSGREKVTLEEARILAERAAALAKEMADAAELARVEAEAVARAARIDLDKAELDLAAAEKSLAQLKQLYAAAITAAETAATEATGKIVAAEQARLEAEKRVRDTKTVLEKTQNDLTAAEKTLFDLRQIHASAMKAAKDAAADAIAKIGLAIKAKQAAEKLLADSDANLKTTETNLKVAKDEVSKARKELVTAQELLAMARKERDDAIANATSASERLTAEFMARLQKERGLRQELLGLHSLESKMTKVVFVVDHSGSMNDPVGPSTTTGGQTQTSRWDYVKSTVSIWLTMLPCEHMSLVIFNDKVEVFPEVGTLPVNPENTKKFESLWSGKKPESVTDTLSGLRAAWKIDGIDSIVLFTDGAPTSSVEPPSEAAKDSPFGRYQGQVIEEIQKHIDERKIANLRPIPINVIGIGNYLDGKLGPFLIKIAEMTGGTFVGR